MMPALAYYIHHLNPVIFDFGYVAPRWYGFAYLMGFLGAYVLVQYLGRVGMLRMEKEKIADLVLNCCIFGVLLGGRLGYVLFYDLPHAIQLHETPLLWSFSGSFPFWGVLRVMDGGMSAHGGILFTILTLMFFAWRNRKQGANLINIGDASSMVVPIGLCFGRIANFINGELYGRVTSVAWGVKFPSEIWSPTNNADTITQGQFEQLQGAVAEYVSQHATELSARNVSDFVGNHADFQQWMANQQLNIDVNSVAIKGKIAEWVGMTQRVLPADMAKWWEHSTSGMYSFLHGWFDRILLPRHPSQLYEALLEGVLLFVIVWCVGWFWRKEGMAGGAFLTLYPVMRIIGEQFRVGDAAPAWMHTDISLGVWYSLLMMVPAAIYWAYWMRKGRRTEWAPRVETAETGAAKK